MEIVLIVLVVAAIVAGAIYWGLQYDKQRTAAFREVVSAMGLQFHAEGDQELLSRVSNFKLFSTGHSRRMKNALIAETPQARIGIFDYRYTTGGGKHSSTHSQTVAAMESPKMTIPEFSLRPEIGFFDAIGSMLGFQDIDFDDHPEFSKTFVLKSPQAEETRRFFDEPLLSFFADQKSICLEARHGAFIYFRRNKRIKPEELRDFLEQGYAVYKAFTDRLERAS